MVARKPRNREHFDRYGDQRQEYVPLAEPETTKARPRPPVPTPASAQRPSRAPTPNRPKSSWFLWRPLIVDAELRDRLIHIGTTVRQIAHKQEVFKPGIASLRHEIITPVQTEKAFPRNAAGAQQLHTFHEALRGRFAASKDTTINTEFSQISVHRTYGGNNLPVTDFYINIPGAPYEELDTANEVLASITHKNDAERIRGIKFLHVEEGARGHRIDEYRDVLGPAFLGAIALGPMQVPMGYPEF